MAFELPVLVEKLKSRGLDVAEEAAKVAVEEILNWASEGCLETGGLVAVVGAVAVPEIKKLALGLVDKIDGQVG